MNWAKQKSAILKTNIYGNESTKKMIIRAVSNLADKLPAFTCLLSLKNSSIYDILS